MSLGPLERDETVNEYDEKQLRITTNKNKRNLQMAPEALTPGTQFGSTSSPWLQALMGLRERDTPL